MTTLPNYYETLNVPINASFEEIKVSFRRLARQFHPDLNPDNPQAAGKFQEIHKAYEVLSDPQQRTWYDQKIAPSQTTSPPTSSSSKAQEFYVKGVQKALIGQYQEAINYYTKAIELRPQFLEAYLQRCEAYFCQKSYVKVLENCHYILQFAPQSSSAYYYRGRVRKQLGYLESAIESYTKAIYFDPKDAQIFYHRGFAYQELKQKKFAINDFTKAADLYQKQGNISRYRSALYQLKVLQSHPLKSGGNFFKLNPYFKWLKLMTLTVFQILLNPSGEMLAKFSQLSLYQRLVIGLFDGLLAELIITIVVPSSSFWGLTLFIALTLWMMLNDFWQYHHLNASTSLFVAGNLTLCLSFMAMVKYSPVRLPNLLEVVGLTTLGSSFFLVLYASFSQILNFPEGKSYYLTTFTLILLVLFYRLVV